MAKPTPHQQQFNPDYQYQHPPLPAGKVWQHELDNGLVLRGEFIESAAGANAPVLHFTHGNGMACRLYESFLAPLQANFALFLHDTQGHGDSDNGDPKQHSFVGWNGSAKRLIEVIRAQQTNGFLKQRRLIGCGHSFGGALTLLAAASEPDLFESLVLFDAMMFPPAMAKAMSALSITGLGKQSPLSKQARVRGAEWPDIDTAFRYFYKRGMLKTWHDDSVYSYLTHCLVENTAGGQQLRCPPWIEASIFGDAPRGLWKAIDSIQVPSLLFYGKDSYDFLAPAAKRAARHNPQISAEPVAGNHFFMLEDPSCLSAHPIWQTLAA
jgi:pimeloyl-ACP methyl ester carboxylesterase